MTREQYKKEVEAFFNKEFIERVTFPVLLMRTAEHLFMIEDMTSNVSYETRRRLKQMNESGYTDE